jgi:hypothetical protein
MRFNVSSLVQQLRLAHHQMTQRKAAAPVAQMPVEIRMPGPKLRPQVRTHTPADDHHLRASQL